MRVGTLTDYNETQPREHYGARKDGSDHDKE